MCGFIITNIDLKLEKYKSILKHRGPDFAGFFKDDFVKIIFNRLAIIDLNKDQTNLLHSMNILLCLMVRFIIMLN